MKLSNKAYDVLKWIALILIPALETLYISLAGAWNLPYVQQVSCTLSAIGVFLGVLIGVSNYQYKRSDKND